MALPLLLFATACGEGTGPVAESDQELSNVPQMPSASGASAPASPIVANAELALADGGDVDLDTEEANVGVSDGANAGTGTTTVAGIAANGSDTSTAVPEPTTLAGLAIAALGLGAIKRKQAA